MLNLKFECESMDLQPREMFSLVFKGILSKCIKHFIML